MLKDYLKKNYSGCFKHIKIPFDDLYKMPVRDRKYFIMKHNEAMEQERAEYEKMTNGGGNTSNDINMYTDRSQGNYKK